MSQYEPNFTDSNSNNEENAPASSGSPSAAVKKPAAKFKRYGLIVLGVVMVLGAGAYFASKRGLSEAALSLLVDSWIEEQERIAKEDGTEVDIAYDEIELHGNFSNHFVVIKKPIMRVAPEGLSLAQAGSDVTVFSTDRVILYPETPTLERVRIELPDTLDIFDMGAQNPNFRVKPNTPLMVAVGQEKVGDANFTTISHYLPNTWDIAYLNSEEAGGEEDQTPLLTPSYHNYKITMNEGARYYSRIISGGHLGDGTLALSGLVVSDEANNAALFSVADIKGEWKGVIDEEQRQLQALNVSISDVVAGDAMPDMALYLPASLKLAVNMSAAQIDADTIGASTVALDDFELKLGKTALRVQGGFEAGAEEILPVGKADVRIENLAALVSQLQQDDLISVGDVRLVQDVANAVVGEKNDLTQTVEFTLERARGGAFTVGKVPFEVLVATVLRSAMEGVTITTPSGTITAPAETPATQGSTKEQ